MQIGFTFEAITTLKRQRMKITITSIGFIFLALLLTQCKDKTPQEAELDKLFDEVMVIHDDVMPKTAVIHRLKKKLKKQTNEDNLAPITMAIKQLDAADEGMMQWMDDFKKPKGKEFEEAKSYLNKEKDRITRVKQDILSAISVAEELIPKAE